MAIDSNAPDWQGRTLGIYRNLEAGPATERLLRIKMMSMSHDIVAPLGDLLKK